MSLKRSLVASALLLSVVTPGVGQTHSMMEAAAPPFSLASLAGPTVSLEDFRGRLVVLHFGAGW